MEGFFQAESSSLCSRESSCRLPVIATGEISAHFYSRDPAKEIEAFPPWQFTGTAPKKKDSRTTNLSSLAWKKSPFIYRDYNISNRSAEAVRQRCSKMRCMPTLPIEHRKFTALSERDRQKFRKSCDGFPNQSRPYLDRNCPCSGSARRYRRICLRTFSNQRPRPSSDFSQTKGENLTLLLTAKPILI